MNKIAVIEAAKLNNVAVLMERSGSKKPRIAKCKARMGNIRSLMAPVVAAIPHLFSKGYLTCLLRIRVIFVVTYEEESPIRI